MEEESAFDRVGKSTPKEIDAEVKLQLGMAVSDKELIKEALNELGSALSDHKHKWTTRQRKLYDKAMNILTKNQTI